MKKPTVGQLKKVGERFAARMPRDILQLMLREEDGLLDLVAGCDWERRDMELVRQALPQRAQEAPTGPLVRERASGLVEVTLDPQADWTRPPFEPKAVHPGGRPYILDAEQYLLQSGVHRLESMAILQRGEDCIDGESMLYRGRGARGKLVRCPYGARTAEAFYAKRDQFPRWWHSKWICFSFPATVCVNRDGCRYVRVVYPRGGEWLLDWHRLGYDWSPSDRFPRSRVSPLSLGS
ncbi:MAG: hypothetical protein COV10_04535 [Candidatus Vogelbacteria bacterium CG10_big_fil_rev_8_21_14_0_10_51_16]|uniref:Uncharacterized protein n=1 Tax=Candidatus Vogelbacteria bacterium CG10_big_fil_rev_8_21_14_0_10_51_16 TaxID=1975045 RepID=A0A2H0RD65_9BACT|nr:MAG: hypothetical protein COV10_04535 [Candidatus Vogelbacteria bacterium CG10_big_fil_rev_8_21_14_0_10_51_16]